jgi:hypothetical protein
MPSRIAAFFLRPFARPIRYGMLKIMKRLRQPDDGRPIIATSEHLLTELVLPSTFDLFHDEKFRTLASFSKLPRAEHDRIFNELVVSGIAALTICLDAAPSFVRPEDFHFWKKVQEHTPKQFQRELMKFGVASSNAKLMRELIAMRYEEYQGLMRHTREINELENESFRGVSEVMQHVAVGLQSIGIGTADHIKRGKLAPGDPLIRFLTGWLFELHKEVSVFIKRL